MSKYVLNWLCQKFKLAEEYHNEGHEEGKELGIKEGYDKGYQKGAKLGYSKGYEKAKTEWYDNGYKEAKEKWYNKGYEEAKKEWYNKGLEKGTVDGYSNGLKDGEKVGYHYGFQEGNVEGYNKGLEEGKNIFEIKRNYVDFAPSISDVLMKSCDFSITDELRKTIREDMLNKLKVNHTQSQWEMILTRRNNVYVVAGAGSGKSTTLVSRIILLHCYLRIPLEEITVFSFTRASTQEFRDKLAKALKKYYGESYNASIVNKVVRTFHSKILEFGKEAGLIGSYRDVFEYMGSNKSQYGNNNTSQNIQNIQHANTEQEENDYLGQIFDINLSDEQEELLKAVYKKLFEKDQTFRENILSLYRYYIYSQKGKLSESAKVWEERINSASNRDQELTKDMHDLLVCSYSSKEPKRFMLSKNHKDVFYANAYQKDLDLYIVYIPEDKKLLSEKTYSDIPIGICLGFKRKVLIKFSNKNIRFVSNQKQVGELEEEIKYYKEGLENHQAPHFKYCITGDLIEQDIWQALYAQVGFIENLGLNIEDVSKHSSLYSQPKGEDKKFLNCLGIFWRELNFRLEEMRMRRNNDLLNIFSENNTENFTYVENTVKSMKHVFIDEFQDISPSIIKWVRGVLHYQYKLGDMSSLMCIGDDWQSIYGWRGSNPEYLINFEETFKTNPVAQKIMMEENFRNYQDLVNKAEKVLSNVNYKINKHGRCINVKDDKTPTLQVINSEQEQDIAEYLVEVFNRVEKVNKEIRDKRRLNKESKEQEETIYVLARKNDQLKDLKKHLMKNNAKIERSSFVKFLTFHKSKGLEADYCFLIGDCYYNTTVSLKNLFYELANYKQSYDQAQRDEAYRLAYVALTRAKKGCYWFVQHQTGGCAKFVSMVD